MKNEYTGGKLATQTADRRFICITKCYHKHWNFIYICPMHRGMLYIAGATFCFTMVNITVKYLKPIPAHELIFFRSLVSLMLTVFLIKLKGLPLWGKKHNWLFIRGASGVAALFLFFYTIKEIPLATATTLQYLSPVFTVVLGIYLLKEKVLPIQWLFFAISFAGVVFIKGFNGQVSSLHLGMGLLSAFFSAIAYNAIVKCKGEHPLTIVMYFPLIGTPVMGLYCLYDWVTPIGFEWLLLIGMGVFTQFAQVLMTRALHSDKTSIITPFKYLGTVYALILGYVIFDEKIGSIALLGMALVVAGVVLNTYWKDKVKRNI